MSIQQQDENDCRQMDSGYLVLISSCVCAVRLASSTVYNHLVKKQKCNSGPRNGLDSVNCFFFFFFDYNAVKTADQMLHFKCVFAGLGLVTSVSGFLLPPPFHNGSAL